MFWDFITLRPETTHQVLFLFSDRGIPDGYRHMNGYGSHTFKLVNAQGKYHYCKFHYKTNQGIKNLPPSKATELSATDPDYGIRDLYNAIANNDFPVYNMSVQIMTPEQAAAAKFNPFDLTKIWPQSEYPLKPVGKLVLNKNPTNYFAEIEQIAFSPSHMIPGIEPSPDKMLLARLFAYDDTHRHRLGANYLQLGVNRPSKARNFQRDGPQTIDNQGDAPNYHPNSFGGPDDDERARALTSVYNVTGDVKRYDSGDEDNYSQAKIFYQKVLDAEAQKRLIDNISGHLKDAADFIQERAIKNFSQVDATFGRKLAEGLKAQKHIHANL